MLGLHCRADFSLIAVGGLLMQGFSCCRAQAPALLGSVVVASRLQGPGWIVEAPRLGCSKACGIFPGPGIELASPALAGGFLTTEPPGKPNGTFDSLLSLVGRVLFLVCRRRRLFPCEECQSLGCKVSSPSGCEWSF